MWRNGIYVYVYDSSICLPKKEVFHNELILARTDDFHFLLIAWRDEATGIGTFPAVGVGAEGLATQGRKDHRLLGTGEGVWSSDYCGRPAIEDNFNTGSILTSHRQVAGNERVHSSLVDNWLVIRQADVYPVPEPAEQGAGTAAII